LESIVVDSYILFFFPRIFVRQNNNGGNSAALWRIHHALGDGISFATVAQQALKYADGTPVVSVIPKKLMEKKTSNIHDNNSDNRPPWYTFMTLAWKLSMATAEVLAMPWTSPDHDTFFSKGIHDQMVRSRLLSHNK